MSEIMVKPQRLINYAQEMDNLKKRMDEAISSSEAIVGKLSQVWEDENHTQFDADFKAMTEKFRAFSVNIKTAADKARNHAEIMISVGK